MKDLLLCVHVIVKTFHVVVWQTTSKNCTKRRAKCAARLFFQTDHCFLAPSLLNLVQRQRLIKIELCVMLSALRLLHVGHVYKIGEVSFHVIGSIGFHVGGKE